MTQTPARRGRPPSGGREQIIAATYDLLDEIGIAKLTTKAVAERAGVSEGNIFYHFKDRAGLLAAAFESGLSPLADYRAQGMGDGSLRETLIGFTAAVEQFLNRSLVVIFAAQADAELHAGLMSYMQEHGLGPHQGVRIVSMYLRKLQQEGVIRDGVDVETVAFMILGTTMMRVSHQRLLGHDNGVPTRDQVVDAVVALLT